MNKNEDLDKALERLQISEFKQRIWNSNSTGELFHIWDYLKMAEVFGDVSWFRPMFLNIVKMAEENWKRPESVFQHIPKIIVEMSEYARGADVSVSR